MRKIIKAINILFMNLKGKEMYQAKQAKYKNYKPTHKTYDLLKRTRFTKNFRNAHKG